MAVWNGMEWNAWIKCIQEAHERKWNKLKAIFCFSLFVYPLFSKDYRKWNETLSVIINSNENCHTHTLYCQLLSSKLQTTHWEKMRLQMLSKISWLCLQRLKTFADKNDVVKTVKSYESEWLSEAVLHYRVVKILTSNVFSKE